MERAKFARVDTLVAALSCPLCFEMVKDCVVTPCGHSFCRSCAGDAVTRKHCCPVCQVGVIGGESGLIRNFLVDEATQAVRKATEDTDVAYMRLLFDTAAEGGAPAASALPQPPPRSQALPQALPQVTAPPPAPEAADNPRGDREVRPRKRLDASHPEPALSPIEEVLVTRMREAFLGYQSYYARERATHEAEIVSLTERLRIAQREEKLGVAAAAVGSGAAHTSQALEAAIGESRARFEAGMEALLRDFDNHAAAAAPPPSLLPSTVTVIVASRGVRFDTQLLPTHFPENVYNKVRAHYASSGDEVRGFGPDRRLYLQALSATRTGAGAEATQTHQTHPINAATQTVFSQCPGGRIGAGWALVVDGAVLLASEEVKPCFAREYRRLGKEAGERVDYFTCGECKLNWLCAPCAAHCHRSCRDVKPFSLNHLPTWACCYCSKKKARIGCKLAGGVEEGRV